jgi:hypothetical protein
MSPLEDEDFDSRDQPESDYDAEYDFGDAEFEGVEQLNSSEIVLHEGQSEVYEALFIDKTTKYGVNCCARGWGKSFLMGTAAATAVFELLELEAWVPHKVVYIIAPTYGDVVDIYYPLLAYELGLERYALKTSRDEGRFIFAKGVELRLLSYEAVERMRGRGAYFVGWDEVSSCKKGIDPKEAWQSVVQPCLVTRWSPARAKAYGASSPGRALFISTPKGYNYFYELFNKKEVDEDWNSWHFDYRSSPYLDETEIEKIKKTIDPLDFASEYMASFEESGNNVFYCFDRKVHVRKDLEPFAEGEDVHVAIDFNVGIMAASVFALRGGQMQFLDEFKDHPDTENLAIALKTRYKDKGHKVFTYPDPTGKARKSSAPVGVTDFSILESYGLVVNARPSSPPIADSVQAVNRMLKTADGAVHMWVDSKCEGTIKSLERTKWVDKNPDSATIDKSEGIEHYSDGVRYATEYLFPVRSGKKRVARGFNF